MLGSWFFTDPLADVDAFERRVDALVRGLDGRHGLLHVKSFDGLKVAETDTGWALTGELPGLAPDDLTITVEDGVLTVSAERTTDVPDGFTAQRRERRGGTFRSSLRLPANVAVDQVEASLVDGLLRLDLPRLAKPAPRTIPVHA